jgi:hypothetical protein
MIAAVATSCAILMAAVFIGIYTTRHTPTTDNAIAVSQTVDLWDAGTVRGEQPGQLQAVSLPAAFIKLTVILPRHSSTGQYLIAITRDQNGNGVIAESLSDSVSVGSRQEILTDLDLRKANAGQYFLSTTHEQDQAAYYFPLEIK